MRTFINQIERSLETELYMLSLFGALTVPDIAGALDSTDGFATGAKYAAWFDTWIRPQSAVSVRALVPPEIAVHLPEFPPGPLTGEACYFFRCSLLHQGTTQHPKNAFQRLLFVEPGASKSVLHYNQINDALNIDLRLFCREMIAGTREWLDRVEGTEPFESNYTKFVRPYPTGLAPYIVGMPVVG